MQLINDEVRIENCNICDSKCSICPREKMTRKQTVMPDDHFKSLANQAVNLGANMISIFGYGEPILDRGIVNKVSHCSDLGLFTFITTNASTLDLDLSFSLLRAGLSKIRFSVHGIGENYEKVHRGLSWDKITRNIANFLSMNRIKFERQCKTAVSVIPMNDETVEDIIERWDKNVDEIEIWRPHNWTDGRKYRRLTKSRKRTCGRPAKGPIQINADGNMMICCFDFDAQMIVGNTYENTIEEILKGSEYEHYRDNHKKGFHEGTPCETCDQLNIGDKSPLLYSNVDVLCGVGKTSSTKFNLEE